MSNWIARLNQPAEWQKRQAAWIHKRIYLLRRIALIVSLTISAVLLFAAYTGASSPGISAGIVAGLVVLGVLLTPVMYGLFSFVIWVQRGQQPDADPNSLAYKLAKSRFAWIGGFVPIAVMFLIIFGLPAFIDGFDQGYEKNRADRMSQTIGDACLASAAQAIKAKGGNPTAPDMQARVNRYCSCVVTELQLTYRSPELERISTLDERGIAGDKQLVALFETCGRRAN